MDAWSVAWAGIAIVCGSLLQLRRMPQVPEGSEKVAPPFTEAYVAPEVARADPTAAPRRASVSSMSARGTRTASP